MEHGQTVQTQIRPAERGVWSGSSLFAKNMFYFNLKKEKKTTQQPLKRKWTGPIDKGGENSLGPNGLNMIYFIYINHYKETNTRSYLL